MKKIILTAVTAAAIAFNPAVTAPAQAADTKDVLGALLGIAAVAAIANEVRKNRDDKRTTNRSSQYDPYYPGGQWDGQRGRHHGHREARVLPGQCLRVVDGGRRNDDGIVFPQHCLNQAGVRSRDLPDHCMSRVRSREGRIPVYEARCLADAGWSLPRLSARR